MTPFVDFLDYVGAADLATVGGKGANLGEMMRAGFNVPPGFCVTTHAFTQFMSGDTNEIYSLLDGISGDDIESVRQVGKRVRSILAQLPLPSEIAESIEQAWNKFGSQYAYAVRSSATAEDLPGASFAGQQDTYLNIHGKQSLLEKVKDCFISLFTDRAILYRIQNGFEHRRVALSVVVQRMVQPEISGILFTADPVVGTRDLVSIDASFGLGEALVSGLVSADLYQVDKRSREIVKRKIATKDIAIRSLDSGGTQRIQLEGEERTRPALMDKQILELTDLGVRIESHYGIPQDIEWAIEGGQFYITQARPITSLYPLPEPRPNDDALHVYFSLSHLQVMTDPMPPLSISVWRALLSVGHVEGELESQLVHSAGGRFYADLSPLLRNPLARRLLLKGTKNMDQLATAMLAEISRRKEFYSKGKKINPLSVVPWVLPVLLKALTIMTRGRSEGVAEAKTELINSYINSFDRRLGDTHRVEAKLELVISEMRNIITPILTWVPHLMAGLASLALLKRIMRNKGCDDELAALERGVSGNVVTEMNLRLGDLADVARRSDPLVQHLGNMNIDPGLRLKQVDNVVGGKDFKRLWDEFVSLYGARCPSEIDLSRPRWSEDPSSLLQMVVNTLGNGETGTHRVHYRELVEAAKGAEATLLRAARKGWWGWLRSPILRRLIRVSRNLTPLREHHKFFVVQLFVRVRQVLKETGHVLRAQGRIEDAQDVWFLSLPEIFESLASPAAELKTRVARRKDAFDHYRHLTPPRVMTSSGEILSARPVNSAAPEGVLIGSPVSAGVVEGRARVVADPGNEILFPGEILVAPFTDPGWTPLFVNAAGLITEVGGLMTHGSVVAREYGIPAVLGVLDATKRIRTGQLVRVHGDAGYIELLDEQEENAEEPVS